MALARASRAATGVDAEVFRAAFEHAPIATALAGPDGRWSVVNPALCALLRYSEEELLALAPADLTAPGVEPVAFHAIAGSRVETCYMRADGDPVWVSLRAGALGDGGFVVQIGNLSERKRAERRLKRLADHDALTWLPNRRCFLEGLRTELQRMHAGGEYGALLLLDLDGFKQVNDTDGHAAGDRVLQATADVLRRRLRASDLIGRLGGDEFAVLLRNVTPRQAREIAGDLDAALRGSDGTLHLGASIGVADVDERMGDDGAALLAAADEAMYRAKTARRGG
jgi:diguanylate cyclase (GGDEF)-like protein/PAS domain S-box-containing protein